MKLSRHTIRMLGVLMASALGLLVLAGCLALPAWKKPPFNISHTSTTKPLTDTLPDMAIYNGVTYIVFQGYDGNDQEIYLQGVKNFASTAVTTTIKNLTNDALDECDPHIVSGNDGYLYITYRGLGCFTLSTIDWMRVRASDLAVVNGPSVVSNLPYFGVGRYNDQPRITHADGNNYSLITWVGRQTAEFTPTIFLNKVTDAGSIGTPITVSVGTGCQSTSVDRYDQLAPRIGSSKPNGNFTQIAWYGDTSVGDSAFWRQIYNPSMTFNTDCKRLSDGTIAGTDNNVELSVSQEDNQWDSYVAWTKYDGANNNVYARRVTITGTICSYVRAPYVSSDSFNPVVAAGHNGNNWMHLAYEHVLGASHIWYNLYDTSNCGATPVSANAFGDSQGVFTLTVSPWPSGDNGNLGTIGVEPNTTALAASVVQANQITPDQLNKLAESGMLSKDEVDSILQDGSVNLDRLGQVIQARTNRVQERFAAAYASSSELNKAGPVEGTPDVAPSTPWNDHCAEDPSTDGCAQPTAQAAIVQPNSPSCGGITGNDAVAVAWADGTTNQAYATEIGAGSTVFISCLTGALASNGANQLRTIFGSGDNTPTAAQVKNGIAHVVWAGFTNHICNFFICFYDDDDIYYAVTHIPVYLPLTLKNF